MRFIIRNKYIIYIICDYYFFLDLEFLEWEMMLDFYIIGSDIMYKDR